MGLLDWLFGSEEAKKDSRKRIFISFAIEDEIYRDHLKAQARREKSPFDFIDMSVKEPWKEREWKEKCRTKIRRCHGVIVLISRNTYNSKGVKHEINCARKDKIPIIGMYIKKTDKGTPPLELIGKRKIEWTWPNIEAFINKL